MMKDKKYIVPLLLAAVLLGCDRQDSAPAAKADDGRVVMTVDGVSLTRGQMDAHVKLMLSLARGGNPQMTPANLNKLKNQLLKTLPDFFVVQTVIRNYAKRENVNVSDELLVRYRKSSMRKARHLKARDYDDLLKKLGSKAAVFDEMVRDEALAEAVRESVVAANPTNLPSGYGEAKLAEIKAFNLTMVATNALIYARATNVWEQLKAGADFGALVQKYSDLKEERDDNGEWGLIDEKILADDPGLFQAVKRLSPGEFTPPVDGDNGLMIARLDSKDEAKGEYTLSRIFFQLPMFYKELSPDELVKLTRKEHAERVWSETLAAWRKNAKVECFAEKKGKTERKGEKK